MCNGKCFIINYGLICSGYTAIDYEHQEYAQDSIDATPTVVFEFCRFQTHNYSIGIGQ